MTTFALNRVSSGKQQNIDKLIVDGQCYFDEFEGSLEIIYRKELGNIYQYIDYLAEGNILPDTKFKDITPKSQSVKEYEFRSKNLRVYAIKNEGGKIIILGGLKSTQNRDLKRFRIIKKAYLKFLKNQNHA